MKKNIIIISLLCLSIFLISNVYGQIGARTNILNFAKFTAGNAQFVTNGARITVATMYGGSLSVSPAASKYQPINNLSRQIWTITVTNKGNATARFTAKVVATNTNKGGGVWSYGFTNNPVTNI